MRIHVLATYTLLLALAGYGVGHAQIPVPQADSSENSENTSNLQQTATDEQVEAAKRLGKAYSESLADDGMNNRGYTQSDLNSTIRYSSDQEKTLQQKRQQARAFEKSMVGGFEWLPFTNAGSKTIEFLEERKTETAALKKDASYIDVAVADVDRDGKPDMMLSYWDPLTCGLSGCQFSVHFGNKKRPPLYIKAERIALIDKGLLIDRNFYGF